MSETEESIPSLFDVICFSFGENDAIVGPKGFQSICYLELQQASVALACQLYHRYRPTFCLLELRGVAAAEAVCMVACMRIGVPFVPVSVEDYHSGGRLASIVSSLRESGPNTRIVALVRCNDDRDPILSHFSSMNLHNVVYVNGTGDLLEPMNVSDSLPSHKNDDLYVLFTSGTSGSTPKAVVGSSRSTLHRLKWFANKFPSRRDTVIARRSKLTFVDSITELFSALLFPPAVLYAMDANELRAQGVSAILSTPCTRVTLLPSQLAQMLLSSPSKEHSIDTIIISGEPCPASLLETFRNHFPSTTLVNLYGQTESTGDVLCAVLTEMKNPVIDNVVAVGKPIPGVSVSVTPKDKELVVTGNLSNGYLHSTSPFSSFHTGDVGFCQDGCWYVKGRIDDVAKINGIITSPSEVEAVFFQIYSLPCAAAIVQGQVYVLVESHVPFSRQTMRENGVPWNLIPKQVFNNTLPKSGGAGKIDRSRVKSIITKLITSGDQKASQSDSDVIMIVSTVLGVAVDGTKSFVEMGGDSALAVTLLYKLRVAGHCRSNITAWHILEADSIMQLEGILNGERKLKRKKIDIQREAGFVVKETKRAAKGHLAVEFKACVDAAPAVHGSSIYGACQGGIIQWIVKGKVVTHYDLDYKVQADLILADNSLIVCGYNPQENSGIVMAMELGLASVKWQSHLKGMIKSTPVQVGAAIYVVAGKWLHIIDAQAGHDLATVELQSLTESKPAVVMRGGAKAVVYAFSDWDSGLVIVEGRGTKVTTVSDIACPVYADVLAIGKNKVVVCDILGSIHTVDVNTLQVKSSQVSKKPIFSSPVMMTNWNIVFGCHDGIVRCLAVGNLEQCWEYDTKSVVYSKPLSNRDGSVVICTTAGDIIRLKDGKETWSSKVDGEIWSAPMLYDGHVVVGARDSCIHVIDLG